MKTLKSVARKLSGGVTPKSRPLRQYAAAKHNRLTSDWIAGSTSADSEVRGSLRLVRDRSRELGRDNDYVKGFFRECQNNVVGRGIPFQSQLKMKRGGKLDDKTNDMIETQFVRWTNKKRCHTAGKLSFQEIERLIIREVAEAGEIFVRIIINKFDDSKIPMAIELLEGDQLDEQKNGTGADGNQIRMGVEIDRWGRPVAYHFIDGNHPGDYQFPGRGGSVSSRTIRVPASEILHIGMFERNSQTRCMPWLAASISRLNQMSGLEEAEVISARATASLMGFITSEEGELQGDGVVDSDRVTDFEPGVFKKLAPGETVSVPDLHRAPGQFEPFVRAMLRGVAMGAGVSYSTISRDYSQSNFSSSRMDMLSERDNWRVLQAWMIRNFHQPLFERWLDIAVLSGAIQLPGYELNPEQYQAVRWMPRGWAWIDPAKEVAAAKDAIKAGLSTITKELAEQGDDVEEVFAQLQRERELAKVHDLKLDSDFANDPTQQAQGFDDQGQGKPNLGPEKKPKKKPDPAGIAGDADGDGIVNE